MLYLGFKYLFTEKIMNIRFSTIKQKLSLFIALVMMAGGNVFLAQAQEKANEEETKKVEKEILQYERIPNKIKPVSSTLSIDLPFTFDDPFTSEEIPEDMKDWFSESKRCQADREDITVVCSYVKFTPSYINSYVKGNEKEAMRLYLKGSMVDRMKKLEEDKVIKSFSYRIMDIKLTDSKDTALLLKGSYREKPQNFEVWVLQILHKREIWQILFFFDPKDVAMQDAVEAACFSAVAK